MNKDDLILLGHLSLLFLGIVMLVVLRNINEMKKVMKEDEDQ